MTEPDFAMGTSLVAGTARGLAPLPAFLLGAEAVPLLWVGDGKVASPSLEGGQVAVLRLHAASTGHVTKPAYSCARGMYVRCGTKVVRVPRKLRTSENSYSTHSGECRFSVGAYAPSHFTVSTTFCALGKPTLMLTASPFMSKMIVRPGGPLTMLATNPSEYPKLFT